MSMSIADIFVLSFLLLLVDRNQIQKHNEMEMIRNQALQKVFHRAQSLFSLIQRVQLVVREWYRHSYSSSPRL